MSRGILWFRQDLRLSDNPALREACSQCDELLCLYIDDPLDQTPSRLGSASRVWLHHSLAALRSSLQEKGTDLYFFQGDALGVLQRVAQEIGASQLFWNRCYDPVTVERDKHIKSALQDLQPRTFNGLLIREPWDTLKADGSPYRVYTPFWKATAALIDEEQSPVQTLNRPQRIPGLPSSAGDAVAHRRSLAELQLLPRHHWHQDLMSHWQAGESAARASLDRFLASHVNEYGDARDLPGQEGTSRLSMHLHFGEISARHVMNRLLAGRRLATLSKHETVFAKELVWREFAHAILFHFPHTVDQPMDRRFEEFPWAEDAEACLARWQQGRTGIPIVDAGMRELYATGWMHNRVRMIVASFLVKNLLIPWQHGERWFRDTLVDADLASNCMGWQWSAGCGVDAAPFFRVFNPVLQGERFDGQGNYVRQWVPELAEVPLRYLHQPWQLDQSTLAGIDYPEPLVDLKQSRQRALEAFSQIKGT